MKHKFFFLLMQVIALMIVAAMCQAQPNADFKTIPKLQWRFMSGGKMFSAPVISNGVIYAGSNDSVLHAVDLITGKEKWHLHTGGEIRSAVCMHNDHLYLNGGDGILYDINASTGTVNWKFKSGDEHRYDFADYFNSTPVLKDTVIYFGSGDSAVYAVGAMSGKKIWSFKTGGLVHGKPAADSSNLYIGSFDGYVYAIRLSDGGEAWRFKTVGHDYFPKGEVQGSPVVFNSMVFIGARDYNLYALDAEKGYCHWNKSFFRGWALNPGINDSLLYIGSADERVLICAYPATGKEKWNKKMEFLVFGNNAYTDSMLYVGTTIGKLHGIDKKTGDKLWSYETVSYAKNRFRYFKPDDSYRDDIYSIITSNEQFLEAECVLGGIFTMPAIDGDRLVFTSTEGAMYCLKRN